MPDSHGNPNVPARIIRRDAQPVQSGPALLEEWMVEFEPLEAPTTDPLMGWVSSTDMLQQVHLGFATLAEAETYCRRLGVPYVIQAPVRRHHRPRSYADNFIPFDEGPAKPVFPH